ncbi:hypothetical protein ACQRIT_001992 [Beauveria bassiana]
MRIRGYNNSTNHRATIQDRPTQRRKLPLRSTTETFANAATRGQRVSEEAEATIAADRRWHQQTTAAADRNSHEPYIADLAFSLSPKGIESSLRAHVTDQQLQPIDEVPLRTGPLTPEKFNHPMPLNLPHDGKTVRGQGRRRSSKGSNDIDKGKAAKPPSQKAMLSRALQKANTAVQLDNAQNLEGARTAYAEACDLLQQVLRRTSGDEDKRKLEAIRQTYSSRIEELDQIELMPNLDTASKALPARPGSDEYSPELAQNQYSATEIASTITSFNASTWVDGSDTNRSHPRQPASPPLYTQQYGQDQPPPNIRATEWHRTVTNGQQGMLQSSFSRSSARSNHTATGSHEQALDLPQPVNSVRANSPLQSPPVRDSERELNDNHSGRTSRNDKIGHVRDGSQNSWLDGIGESGGSTASSTHSMPSSQGQRRKHTRVVSGNTEAEFDTALDAAIEAAYDDGYEPMGRNNLGERDAGEEAVARVLRKVEIARERVRQTEQETLSFSNSTGMTELLSPRHYKPTHIQNDFYDDDSSDDEERMLEEMARDYDIGDFTMNEAVPIIVTRGEDFRPSTRQRVAPEQKSQVEPVRPLMEKKSFSSIIKGLGPSLPPPNTSLPDLPSSRCTSPMQTVRNRRLSGQNPKQLKIDTTKPTASPLTIQSHSDQPNAALEQENEHEAVSSKAASPTAITTKLRENFSSSSLRSIKSRNLSLSNLEDPSDMSPGTPSSNHFGGSRTPAVPTIPTPMSSEFRDNLDSSSTGARLFDDHFHQPTSPGSAGNAYTDAPVPLEPCPHDFMLRPFWLMRCFFQTMVHPRGGYLKNVDDKIANCDLLTAALLKLAQVDTCDADAVLEEMQSLEGILEQVQATLTRKLGNDVGVQGSVTFFKEAGGDGDGSSGVPRSSSVPNKPSFSWRRLRAKSSGVALSGAYNSSRTAVGDAVKGDMVVPSLPMTVQPTSRPPRRDLAQAQFTGPNANYMSSLARLFDAAQAVDQIARQVDDPGLRHADKTQVGLELCTRHAAEFFGFYICRDRLLEHTGTISASDANKQILDKLDVERERGITVKAQTCTMLYNYKGDDYLLHLVDTPGHVDFRAEVTRSYASCGGAILLIDASQGVQAQTVSNFHLAFAQDLALLPVVNKIDMPSADVPSVLKQIEDSFELDPAGAVLVSAKTGKGIDAVLPAVIEKVPHPLGDRNKRLKMLLVDSWYDNFRGVVLLVRIFDGMVQAGDNVVSLGTATKYTVGQVGVQIPDATPQKVLSAGQVGYVYFNPGMKQIKDAKLGDTFTTVGSEDAIEPCPGFEEPKPMVFVAAFPTDQGDYSRLADSINQLVLNDRSVTLQKDHSEALGAGWRLGFLGSLHCSVFQDRLKQEHGRSIIITEPTVPTKIIWSNGREEVVQNPALFPDTSHPHIKNSQLLEPFVKATITVPEEHLGRVIELCEANRGQQKSIEFFSKDQVILLYDVPAAQLVEDFFGKLKGSSKGYATLDYEEAGWRESKLTKVQLLVNKQPVDAICKIVHTSQVERIGRQWVTKFKEHVDRQMFEVVIQAVAGNRVIARETIKPFPK